jgi:hypothetical protein
MSGESGATIRCIHKPQSRYALRSNPRFAKPSVRSSAEWKLKHGRREA